MTLADAYKILELQPGASESDIKRNYYKLARTWHPDKHPDAEGDKKLEITEKFKEISNAYDLLINKNQGKQNSYSPEYTESSQSDFFYKPRGNTSQSPSYQKNSSAFFDESKMKELIKQREKYYTERKSKEKEFQEKFTKFDPSNLEKYSSELPVLKSKSSFSASPNFDKWIETHYKNIWIVLNKLTVDIPNLLKNLHSGQFDTDGHFVNENLIVRDLLLGVTNNTNNPFSSLDINWQALNSIYDTNREWFNSYIKPCYGFIYNKFNESHHPDWKDLSFGLKLAILKGLIHTTSEENKEIVYNFIANHEISNELFFQLSIEMTFTNRKDAIKIFDLDLLNYIKINSENNISYFVLTLVENVQEILKESLYWLINDRSYTIEKCKNYLEILNTFDPNNKEVETLIKSYEDNPFRWALKLSYEHNNSSILEYFQGVLKREENLHIDLVKILDLIIKKDETMPWNIFENLRNLDWKFKSVILIYFFNNILNDGSKIDFKIDSEKFRLFSSMFAQAIQLFEFDYDLLRSAINDRNKDIFIAAIKSIPENTPPPLEELIKNLTDCEPRLENDKEKKLIINISPKPNSENVMQKKEISNDYSLIIEGLQTYYPNKEDLESFNKNFTDYAKDIKTIDADLILKLLKDVDVKFMLNPKDYSEENFIIQKKQKARLIIDKMLPEINSLDELSKFHKLIDQQTKDDYAFIRQERGFFRFSYGNTNTWTYIMSEIQKRINNVIVDDAENPEKTLNDFHLYTKNDNFKKLSELMTTSAKRNYGFASIFSALYREKDLFKDKFINTHINKQKNNSNRSR